MKFMTMMIVTFSFAAHAYHSPTVGNRPEKIEIPSYEKRLPASVPVPQDVKKAQKADKK